MSATFPATASAGLLCTLASGSSGNATYVRLGQTHLLIDAGISCRRILRGLQVLGVAPEDLDAIVLTHEHRDHVEGLAVLHKRAPKVPILGTHGTAQGLNTYGPMRELELASCVQRIAPQTRVTLGDIALYPFATSHDANASIGLRLEGMGLCIGIATDLGQTCPLVEEALQGCDAAIIEANYDEDMLRWGSYPPHLKHRIQGPRGHLSNLQAGELLERIAHPGLRHVLLGHLSASNNTPHKALQACLPAIDPEKTWMDCAPRHTASPAIALRPGAPPGGFAPRTASAVDVAPPQQDLLALLAPGSAPLVPCREAKPHTHTVPVK